MKLKKASKQKSENSITYIMHNRSFLILVYLLLFLSCNNKENKSDDLFSKVQNVSCTKISIDFMLGMPNQIGMIDDIIIILDVFEQKALTLYDYKNNHLINRIIGIGQGPNEVIPPFDLSINNDKKTINLLQRQNGIFTQYNIENLIRGNVNPTNETNLGNIDKAIETSNGYISSGFYEDGVIGFHDNKGIIQKVKNTYPEYLKLSEQVNAYDKYALGQGALSFNNNTRTFVFASFFTGEITFYKLSEDNELIKMSYYDLNKSSELKNRISSSINVKIAETDIVHSEGIYATKDFFYILYLGKTMREKYQDSNIQSSTIFQFDTEGNIINCFKTNKRLYGICVDENNEKIFGISLDDELEYVLVEIDI